MGQYTINGLYNGYKKNSKEREEDDYYATPTVEVINILETLDFDFSDQTILEPCVGEGHMIAGIDKYLAERCQLPKQRYGTDYKDRGLRSDNWILQYNLDTLADDYPINKVDVVIMNPPYSTLEPFLIRALEIAEKKVIVLCRLQVLEGVGRYDNIFKTNPPTSVYAYIDRIQCWKGGIKPTGSSSQAYCWLVWDKEKPVTAPTLHWIKRSNKY